MRIDDWPGPNNVKTTLSFVWFPPSVIQRSIREINNQYINKIEPRINTQMLTGLLNKTLPVFLRIKKFHRPPCMSGWAGASYSDSVAMWSKKAQFTLNDLIFHLHWNPDSQTQKFLLGKLQTSESIVRHEFLIFFLPRKSWCLVFLIWQSFTRMFWLFFCPINRLCVDYAYIKCTGITPFRASASSTLAGCLFIFPLLYC